MGTIKCIGILTSGGDISGMNAAIRAVTRAAIYNGLQVKAYIEVTKGLVTGEIKNSRAECKQYHPIGRYYSENSALQGIHHSRGRRIAYDNMKKRHWRLGSYRWRRFFDRRIAARRNSTYHASACGTIDNDLYGTDTTIGYDTALNTILGAVDKIRDTATSRTSFLRWSYGTWRRFPRPERRYRIRSRGGH